MKLLLGSDLHLEFADLELKPEWIGDVLILAGDICVANDLAKFYPGDMSGVEYRGERFYNFFLRCSKAYKDVIYVAGNHEHYNGDYADTLKNLKACLSHMTNIHVLDKETITIGDVTFIGGTLWTDMNNEDSDTLSYVASRMNDFHRVTNSNRMVEHKYPQYAMKDNGAGFIEQDHNNIIGWDRVLRPSTFSTQDAVVDHKQMLEFIHTTVSNDPSKKYVVVGHHCPSKLSTKPQYEKDVLMNGGYSSRLDDFIIDHPSIKLWVHGHTHHTFDYMVGSTRIACNPRGYVGYEVHDGEFDLQVLEV